MPDHPATAVYGELLFRHLKAAQNGEHGTRAKLFNLIADFRQEFPAECQVWSDRYPGKAALTPDDGEVG